MISPKTLRNINRLLPFMLIWTVFSITYIFIEKGIMGDLNIYPSTNNPYEFKANFIVALLSAIVGGVIIGSLELFVLSKAFVRSKFWARLLLKTLIYLGLMIFFLLVNAIVGNMVRMDVGIDHPQLWVNVWSFLSNFAFWSVEIYISMVFFTTIFYSEISQNLGPGVLTNFFIGKYHQPVEEERIFMFLDMKSSTTIAEKLGHVRYFELLKAYYSIISEPIISHFGEIYQYVGDEIVISWKAQPISNRINCIDCFFSMQNALVNRKDKFLNEYGLYPEFKAGIHSGSVTTGEIGLFKKDIIFTGDVLNTTSRIQQLCNDYGTDLLLSNEMISQIDEKSKYTFNELGETSLKGKDIKIKLYTVQKND